MSDLAAASPVTPEKSFSLTPYDILKTVAVVLMIIDHIGMYFFPQDLEMRSFGRLCVPIWLFLIGYARSGGVDKKLIYAALLTNIATLLTVQQFIGLNILVTIILLRLTLKPLMKWIEDSFLHLIGITVFCYLFAPVTRLFFDYGTMAWVLAIWGAYVRRRKQGEPVQKFFVFLYGVIALILFFAVEIKAFGFNTSQIMLLGLGGVMLYHLLTRFLPEVEWLFLPDTPPWLIRLMAWTGRHTLEIFVVHLLVIYALFIANCHFGLIHAPACPKFFL